jgi:hypothetical protein
MAVSFSKASQTKFFLDVYGAGYVAANIDPLISAGVVLQSGFSDISATLDGTQHKLNLMVGLTQLIKTKHTPSIAHAKTLDQIKYFIAELNLLVATHKWKTHVPMGLGSPVPKKATGGFVQPTADDVAAEFQNQVAKASGIPAHMLGADDPAKGHSGFAKAYPQDVMSGFAAIGKAGSGGLAGGGGGAVGNTVGVAGGSSYKGWPNGGHAHNVTDPGHSHTIHSGHGLSAKKVEAIKKGLAAQVYSEAVGKHIGVPVPILSSKLSTKKNAFGKTVHYIDGITCVSGQAFTLEHAQEILAAWEEGFASDYLPANPDTIYAVASQLTDDDYDIQHIKHIKHDSVSGTLVYEQQKVPNPEKADAKLKAAGYLKLIALVKHEAFHVKQDAIKAQENKAEDGLSKDDKLEAVAPVEGWAEGSPDVETQAFVDDEGNLKKSVKPKPTVGNVVKLRDATTIGQAVRGTSNDSVYRVIAMNTTVKLATRLHSGSKISLRAEFVKPDAQIVECLTVMGMSPKDHGAYYSSHMDCENVPPARVIGAVLFGSGIDFDQQIKSLKDVQ